MRAKEWNVLIAVIAAGIMSFSGVLIETSMNVTFPHLMREFNTTASGIQWVTTGYLLAIAIVVPVSAYLIRNFSSRNLFLAANLIFLAGVLLDSFSPTFAVLLAGRAMQGVGTGIALPLMFHIILTQAPLHKRGVMMGIGTMTTAVAPAIGPTYGGVLLGTMGWRSIFWFLIIVLLVALYLGLKSIPVETVKRTGRFNLPAFVALALGLSALLVAVEKMSVVWLGLALLPLIVFYCFNRTNALLNLHVFKNRRFVAFMFCILVYQAIFLGFSFILPNYLQLGRGANATQAGLFMFPGAVLGAVLAPVSGRVLDVIGPKKPIMYGMLVSVTAVVIMAVGFANLATWQLLVCQMAVSGGAGFAFSNLMTVTLGSLDPAEGGDGNSILNTLQQFVGASSTAIVAQFLSQGVAHDPKNGVALGGQAGAAFLAVLGVAALITFMVMKRHVQKPTGSTPMPTH